MALISHQIGPYRLLGLLGRGGVGQVHRAYDTRLRRRVAIKHLLPELIGDRQARARLLREARALATLSHPAIVPIFDLVELGDDEGAGLGVEGQGVCIVMELIDGPTLAEILADGSLSIARILDLARQVSEGLAAAHAQGILHRDLKTENVLVEAGERARLVDFGLARTIDIGPGDARISAHGAVLGTFRSMSPEQARGLELDERSDLFSLGILIYEMLTSVSPFRGVSPTDTLARVCGHREAPVATLRPDCPPALGALVGRLLQKAPADRPRSALEVTDRLTAIEEERAAASSLEPVETGPTATREPSRPTGAHEPAADDAIFHAETDATTRPFRRVSFEHGRLAGFTALIFLALLPLLAPRFLLSSADRRAAGENQQPDQQRDPAFDPALDRAFDRLEQHEETVALDQAIEFFRRAVDRHGESATAWAGLARAYFLRHGHGGSDPQWLRLALPAARRAVEFDPSSQRAVASLGLVLTADGQFEEAEGLLRRALHTAPEDAGLHEALARLLSTRGRLDEATELLERAIEIAPRQASLWAHLGSVHQAARRYRDAESAFRRGVELRPDSALARRNLAAALHFQGRYAEAAGELQKGLEIRPEATIYSNLGALLFIQGLYTDAADAFEKALAMGTLSHVNLGWANLADAHRFIPGHEDEARRAYRRAIQLTADHLEARPEDRAQRSRLALYLAKIGERRASLAEIERLERAEPPRPEPAIRYRLAVALEILGHRQRAIQLLGEARRSGYPASEIDSDPELFALRGDPAYHRAILDLETTPPSIDPASIGGGSLP